MQTAPPQKTMPVAQQHIDEVNAHLTQAAAKENGSLPLSPHDFSGTVVNGPNKLLNFSSFRSVPGSTDCTKQHPHPSPHSFSYSLTVLPTTLPDANGNSRYYAPILWNVNMYHSEGCGSNNADCTWYVVKVQINPLPCQHTHAHNTVQHSTRRTDPNHQNAWILDMNGSGSWWAATGLDFGCTFTIQYLGAVNPAQPNTSQSSLQTFNPCNCNLHIDMPITGGNTWTMDCPCVAPFLSAAKGGSSMTLFDTVTTTGV